MTDWQFDNILWIREKWRNYHASLHFLTQSRDIVRDTDWIIIITDLTIVIPEDVFRSLEGVHHTGDVDQGPGPRPEVDVRCPQDGGDAPRPQHLGDSLGPPRGQRWSQGGGWGSDNQTNYSHLK